MPANRKILGAAAFSLALAGGGVAGALLGAPTSSGAQDDTTETSTPRSAHGGMGLAAAAEAIGITEDDLRTALEDGQSIAEVAEANGVDVQTVIDAMVATATESLEAAIEELPDRITDLVNREGLQDRGAHGPGGRGGPEGGFGGPGRSMGMGLDAAADAIGISTEDLRSAMQDGSTIAEVAAAHDVDVETVIEALVTEATTRLDEAVADGDLSEDEAAERTADTTERITAMVNGDFEGGGPGRFGPRPVDADADATT